MWLSYYSLSKVNFHINLELKKNRNNLLEWHRRLGFCAIFFYHMSTKYSIIPFLKVVLVFFWQLSCIKGIFFLLNVIVKIRFYRQLILGPLVSQKFSVESSINDDVHQKRYLKLYCILHGIGRKIDWSIDIGNLWII